MHSVPTRIITVLLIVTANSTKQVFSNSNTDHAYECAGHACCYINKVAQPDIFEEYVIHRYHSLLTSSRDNL